MATKKVDAPKGGTGTHGGTTVKGSGTGTHGKIAVGSKKGGKK